MSNVRTVNVTAGDQTIGFTREFEAPAVRVFEAHVNPDLIPQWIGPRGTQVQMRGWDARTGGSWSYVVVGGDGQWPFHGSFHEVTAPTRLVQTFEYDDEPGTPNLDVLTFVDLPDGRSRIDGLSVFLTVEHRDQSLELDKGRDEDFDRLEELLAST